MVGIWMLGLGLQDGAVKAFSVLQFAFPVCLNTLLQGLIYGQFHLDVLGFSFLY
jgi:hypothetical protein